MWSRESSRLVRLVGTLAVAATLGGCFRPLYGPTPSGARLQDVLASVELDKANAPEGQERLGHVVRTELAFDLDGSGSRVPKAYRLSLDVAESVQPTSVDTITGRADAATLNGTARFTLVQIGGGAQVLAGTARANATYSRDQQRFASVRAARDADLRVGKLLAEDIKQRLAAYFATAP